MPSFYEEQYQEKRYDEVKEKRYSMTQVFGWMFYAILLTSVVAVGLPYLMVALNRPELYVELLGVGAISTLILGFVSPIVIARARTSNVAVTFYTLYAASMGLMLSGVVVVFDLKVVGTALLATSAVFGVMALYGYVTKRDLDGFGSVLFTLLIGSLFIILINIFLKSEAVDYVISLVVLGVYIGFIAFDIQRAKRLALDNEGNINIALLIALNLYIDFVYIFIRILEIVARNKD